MLSGTTRTDSRRIQGALRSLGYRHVGWDVDVQDFAIAESRDLVSLTSAALIELEKTGASYAIIILHSWPSVTGRAMLELCRFLRGGVAGTVTLDEVAGSGAVPTRSALRRLARRNVHQVGRSSF
jgi:hypothetical protein